MLNNSKYPIKDLLCFPLEITEPNVAKGQSPEIFQVNKSIMIASDGK